MVVPPGNHPAAQDLRCTFSVRCKIRRDNFGTGETRGRPASGSWSLQLQEKDGHMRGCSRWFVHNAGLVLRNPLSDIA
jgi:hypothetical protein